MRKPAPYILNTQFLLAAWLPLLLLVVGMKIQRGLESGSIKSALSAVAYVSIELYLFTGLAILFYFLNRACRSLAAQRTLLSIFYLITLALLLVETVNHLLFKQSGMFLNWS